MYSLGVELNARPCDQVSYGARDQHLAGLRERRDPGSSVNGDAPHFVLDQLAFTRVKSCPNLDTELSNRADDGGCAPDSSRWAVKGGEKSVPGGIDLAPSVPFEFRAHTSVVNPEQLRPPLVTEPGRHPGRPNDVGEEHGSEHPIGLDRRVRPCEELLDLPKDKVLFTKRCQMSLSLELDQLRSRDVFGKVPGRWSVLVPAPAEREGWSLDGRKDISDVELSGHPREGDCSAGAHRHATEATPPAGDPGMFLLS